MGVSKIVCLGVALGVLGMGGEDDDDGADEGSLVRGERMGEIMVGEEATVSFLSCCLKVAAVVVVVGCCLRVAVVVVVVEGIVAAGVEVAAVTSLVAPFKRSRSGALGRCFF